MTNTIFALSSGTPPAAIAIIRISGPAAGEALRQMTGRLPSPRYATLADLRDADGGLLDRALVLWLPGPGTATGEDMAELHCHGGRAVVAAVQAALAVHSGLRAAMAGEFTRRAFANGRIDLAEAEGLADLLSAETELQRRNALALAEGALSRAVADWRARLLELSAAIEAMLDFGDEDDVGVASDPLAPRFAVLAEELGQWLAAPRAEMLREGLRVVIAGPPNAGKSTLFNALTDSEAAIVTPIAGTTRDLLVHPVAIGGLAFNFVDTAGLRETCADPVETIGIARAQTAIREGDVILWLGAEGDGPPAAWQIEPQIDRPHAAHKINPRHRVSALTGAGMAVLRADLIETATRLVPAPGQIALNARQHGLLAQADGALSDMAGVSDPLLLAEHCRLACAAFDTLAGRATTEQMLDALFGRFCIGK